jgi:hypothetical protein
MFKISKNLTGGTYEVRVITVAKTNSRSDFAGTAKENSHEYADATGQIGIVFGAVVGRATFPYRFSLMGFDKFSDFEGNPEALDELGEVACETRRGYLLVKDGDVYVRRINKQRSEKAIGYLTDFLSALGIKDSDFAGCKSEAEQIERAVKLIEEHIARRTVINLTLVDKEADNGNTYTDYRYVGRVKPVQMPATTSDVEETAKAEL